MNGASDESLLAGVATGDIDAAATLIRRLQARVYGLALAVLADPGKAEDVAQEAFVRLWLHAAAYDPRKGSVRTWMLAITRNLAIDAIRLRREIPMDPVLLIDTDPGSFSGPEDDVSTRDDVARLRSALANVSADQRRALLRAGFGWSAREIAESDGIPLGTAKTRIRDGFAKLRTVLDMEREQR